MLQGSDRTGARQVITDPMTQTDTEAGIAAYYEAIRQARKARRGRRTVNAILGWNAPHITIKVEEPAK